MVGFLIAVTGGVVLGGFAQSVFHGYYGRIIGIILISFGVGFVAQVFRFYLKKLNQDPAAIEYTVVIAKQAAFTLIAGCMIFALVYMYDWFIGRSI